MFNTTLSLCPVCYKTILADLVFENKAVMIKKICSEHGDFSAMVERDAEFYVKTKINDGKMIVYDGHFVDVTEQCNMQCKPCFYPRSEKPNRSIKNILQEAQTCGQNRVILTGGEPFLRSDIYDLVGQLKHMKSVEVVTNGSFGEDDRIFKTFENKIEPKKLNLSISYHDYLPAKFLLATRHIRKAGYRIQSTIFVVNSLSDIEEVVKISEQVVGKDLCCDVRIKAASNIWAEQQQKNKIFCSEMLDKMQSMGARPVWWRDNKVNYFNVELNGIHYALVSWPDIYNIDLMDKDVPPTYTAKNGMVRNIVISMLINEGMEKGYLNGELLK